MARPSGRAMGRLLCHGWYSSLRIPFVNKPVGHVISEMKWSINRVSLLYGSCNAVWIRIIMFDVDDLTITGLKSKIPAVKSVFQNRKLIRRDDFKDSERCITKTSKDSERWGKNGFGELTHWFGELTQWIRRDVKWSGEMPLHAGSFRWSHCYEFLFTKHCIGVQPSGSHLGGQFLHCFQCKVFQCCN